MTNIKKMVAAIMSNPKICISTSISNDLAREVYTQNCPESLIPLLESQNDEILHSSIWIVSELGDKAYPILSFIIDLLKHEDAFVRYYALDCILATSSRIRFVENNLLELIMDNVRLCLGDKNENVKEKANLTFMSLIREFPQFTNEDN